MTRTQSAPSAVALVIRRTFNASREEVFNAFTTPHRMQQFFGAVPRPCKDARVDLRPGGAYSITMYGQNGEEHTAAGTYREVEAPERIVCTWEWLGDEPPARGETLLTMEFIDRGDRTELVLTHENFLDSESSERHTWGWNMALDKYEKLIAQELPPSAVALVLRRIFDAPCEAVFKAWTDPAIMQQFLGPDEVRCKDVRVDLRVGGSYRITMMHPDGEELVAFGTYRDVVVPHRVVCTWTWEEDDKALEKETLLTLEFNARGNKQTELVLTHENFRDAQQCERHKIGWSEILDASARLLS